MQKQFFITILLIINCLVIGNCQKLKTFDVIFKAVFRDSIRYSSDKAFREEFCILKNNSELPIDKYVKTQKGKVVTVKGLTKGNYIIRYENIFSQLIDKPFSISKGNKKVYVQLDAFIDTVKMAIFQELKNGDTLKIYYDVSSCFNHHSELLEIKKENELLKAKLFDFVEKVTVIDSIDKKTGLKEPFYKVEEPIKTFITEKIITNNDTFLMNEIFKRLRMQKGYWATIYRDYYIKINQNSGYSIKCHNIDFNSFDVLKDKIFGIKADYTDY